MENKENLSTDQFGLKKSEIDNINQIFKEFPQIEKVIIFGSRAKGNYKRYSDIDLSLFGQDLTTKILFEIELKLDELLLPYKFDLNIFYDIHNNDFLDHIKRVGKIFYTNNFKEI